MGTSNDVTTTTSGGNNFRALSDTFAVSETVNLTEKIVKLTPSAHNNRQHDDAKVTSLCSLLGMPVKLPNGIVERKHQSNLHTQGVLSIQIGCLGALHGEQSLTVLNS